MIFFSDTKKNPGDNMYNNANFHNKTLQKHHFITDMYVMNMSAMKFCGMHNQSDA